jgi:hypothetical protein
VGAVDASDLHVVGRLMTSEELLRSLRTRFLLAEQRRRHPEVAEEVVDRPIVVTGPARSGTTILFELLALDPGLRSPIASEVLHPVTVPGTTEADRVAMTEAEQELWADVQPEFAAMHELRSDLPVECITITAPSLAGNHWMMVLDDPGDWAPDIGADLAFHRVVLQALQNGAAQQGLPPRRWVLKTPAYVFMLDELLGAYPDASVIVSHRDPARTMPSTVSTSAMVRWLRSDRIELDGLADLVGALFADALTTLADRRAAGTVPGTYGDVRFVDLMADPVAAIAGAYAQIGRDLTDEHARAVTDYLAAKPRGKHGTHTYTCEEWGFDATALRRSMAPYLEAYGIPAED